MEKSRHQGAGLDHRIVATVLPKLMRPAYWLALAALLLTTASGLMLRLYPYWAPESFHFRNWTHAHSHIALLGWAWMGIYVLGSLRFLNESPVVLRALPYINRGLIISIAGMALTFPVTGYATASIFFSSLHMAMGIWFSVLVFRHGNRNQLGLSYFKIALLFMILSGLGPLALGPLAAFDLRHSPWYRFSIYFYLHFQYHGWLTFALIALSGTPSESVGKRLRKPILICLVLTTVMILTLSALEFQLPPIAALAGGLAAAMQLLILVYLCVDLSSNGPAASGWPGALAAIAATALLLKTLILVPMIHPEFARLAYRSRDLVVAYLHLSLLGFVTSGLLTAFIRQGWLIIKGRLAGSGLTLFLASFIIQELFLSARGLRFPVGNVLLLSGSALLLLSAAGMTAGLALVVLQNFRNTRFTGT